MRGRRSVGVAKAVLAWAWEAGLGVSLDWDGWDYVGEVRELEDGSTRMEGQ